MFRVEICRRERRVMGGRVSEGGRLGGGWRERRGDGMEMMMKVGNGWGVRRGGGMCERLGRMGERWLGGMMWWWRGFWRMWGCCGGRKGEGRVGGGRVRRRGRGGVRGRVMGKGFLLGLDIGGCWKRGLKGKIGRRGMVNWGMRRMDDRGGKLL